MYTYFGNREIHGSRFFTRREIVFTEPDFDLLRSKSDQQKGNFNYDFVPKTRKMKRGEEVKGKTFRSEPAYGELVRSLTIFRFKKIWDLVHAIVATN